MAQILRPDEQISVSQVDDGSGGTTNLHNRINDESDSTYVEGVSIISGSLVVGLPEPNTPSSGDSTVYFRIRTSGTAKDITCEILQTSTSKGSLTKSPTSTWTTWSFTATLTDYSDLRVNISGLFSSNFVSEVWVEVPDGVSGMGLEMGCAF
jgi:hypothetical protein